MAGFLGNIDSCAIIGLETDAWTHAEERVSFYRPVGCFGMGGVSIFCSSSLLVHNAVVVAIVTGAIRRMATSYARLHPSGVRMECSSPRVLKTSA